MTLTQKTIAGLQTYCLSPETTDSLVILLHGYGANGQDLISLASEWAPHLPTTTFIAPDAPTPCEAGGPGFQWFSLSDYSRPSMTELIRDAWTVIDNYCDEALKEFGLSDDKMIISGFSQGCMMSLHAGFSRQKPCAGVLGYSGMLLDQNVIENTKNKDIPVYLVHGTDDSVVPVQAWDEAVSVLKANDIEVSGHKTEGLPHGIDLEGLQAGLAFLQKQLN